MSTKNPRRPLRDEGSPTPNIVYAPIDESAKGKNISSLQASRIKRANFIAKFADIPSSILKYRRSRQIADPVITGGTGRSYTETFMQHTADSLSDKATQHNFHISGSGVKKGALSTFPHNIGMIILEVHTDEGDTVYDPFAGHNSRMQMCLQMGRHYMGVDICAEFMKYNREIELHLSKSLGPRFVELIEGSSDNVDLPNECADFTITSPPYWDVEYYGPEKEQLGFCKTYEIFLHHLANHASENYRILKGGSFCCWFVNDFRRKCVFYPYHIDVYKMLVDVGFKPWNIYIIDLGTSLGEAFLQKVLETKIIPKRHEYCIVVKKPGGRNASRPTRTRRSIETRKPRGRY